MLYFKVGVHFDADEATVDPITVATHLDKVDVAAAAATGAGRGFQGFYLAYWQVAC